MLEERLGQLQPSLVEVLNTLLDPRLFSVDRGQLHILLHHSKSLSEFHSLVKDVELTLTEMLDSDVDLADMYLTHYKITGWVNSGVCLVEHRVGQQWSVFGRTQGGSTVECVW